VAANGEAPGAVPEGLVEALRRVADVMALTLVRRMDKPEKIRVLASLGYTNMEISLFLYEKTNTVSKALSRQRAKPPGRKPTAKRNPSARKRKATAKKSPTRGKPAVGRRRH
jgi:hypothetical protein